MNTPEPTAIEVAAQMVSTYVAGDAEALSEQVEPVIDDPRTLGQVMAQLTVIAGESLKLLTESTSTDPHMVLRTIVEAQSEGDG